MGTASHPITSAVYDTKAEKDFKTLLFLHPGRTFCDLAPLEGQIVTHSFHWSSRNTLHRFCRSLELAWVVFLMCFLHLSKENRIIKKIKEVTKTCSYKLLPGEACLYKRPQRCYLPQWRICGICHSPKFEELPFFCGAHSVPFHRNSSCWVTAPQLGCHSPVPPNHGGSEVWKDSLLYN